VAGAILNIAPEEAAEMLGISNEAFRQRLSRARTKMAPLLNRCGLLNPASPCRCPRQAAATQKHLPRDLEYSDAVALEQATDELQHMLSGAPFNETPTLGSSPPRREELARAFPVLLKDF
jgi:site-specific recombinase XerC